jgi:hypothetical protein
VIHIDAVAIRQRSVDNPITPVMSRGSGLAPRQVPQRGCDHRPQHP